MNTELQARCYEAIDHVKIYYHIIFEQIVQSYIFRLITGNYEVCEYHTIINTRYHDTMNTELQARYCTAINHVKMDYHIIFEQIVQRYTHVFYIRIICMHVQ